MQFDVITLFPEMVETAARYGVTGRAIENGIVSLKTWNPRDYTFDRHRTVDDRPYGGGPGMVMKYQPLFDAVSAAKKTDLQAKVVCLSPQGKPLSQDLLKQALSYQQLILVAGRYEGIDERFIEHVCDQEWSLGDYVISGGELGALVIIDAISRLIPGVLGDEESAKQDSYSEGLLDFPHYTRPEQLEVGKVPEVLVGGNHAQIADWRMQQALGRTWLKRPDLLAKKTLTPQQQQLLAEFQSELN